MVTARVVLHQITLSIVIARCFSSSYDGNLPNNNINNNRNSNNYYYPPPDETQAVKDYRPPMNANSAPPGRPPPPETENFTPDGWYADQDPRYNIGQSQQRTFSAGTSTPYTPIDYQFRSSQEQQRPDSRRGERTGGQKSRRGEDDVYDDEIPLTASASSPVTVPPSDRRSRDDDDETRPKFASARQDAVARYMSTFRGEAALRASSSLVGGALGAFIGQSLLGTPNTIAVVAALAFLFLTYLRNPYGELSKALGLTLIFVWQRFYRIRRRYPTWRHVRACIGMGPRRAFPRNDDYQDSKEVNFVYTLLAMGFIGSTCGGNLPLLPTWMGALGGAALFVGASTLKSARGDLARSMGMRVVGVVEELLDINQELHVMRKSGVVAGLILDKVLILDRKHRIKDRIVAVVTWTYDRISNTATQVQRDVSGRRSETERAVYDDDDDDRIRRRRNDIPPRRDDTRSNSSSRREVPARRDEQLKRGFFARKRRDDDDDGRNKRRRDPDEDDMELRPLRQGFVETNKDRRPRDNYDQRPSAATDDDDESRATTTLKQQDFVNDEIGWSSVKNENVQGGAYDDWRREQR